MRRESSLHARSGDMSFVADFHQEALKKDQGPERYLKIQLELEEEVSLSEVEFRFFIVSGLRSLHGEVGAALTFDLLEHDEVSNVAVLRVSREGLVKLWSSLTLLGFYKNQRCAFRVLQVSSSPPES
ncbi:ribonuclease P protein subunit p14 isoform X3 [Boleophthalmus pectinirostris]|uniref:ribonuclease P protein subunit p14 isoform X3 n=1 Tax=Boleophthalmus pectinirostris TaxID=150288 RepID=UPI00242E0D1A|nr:ribonuclease P protein subunit p14 isoform X3 [Boleophthalmus pectinirostris]